MHKPLHETGISDPFGHEISPEQLSSQDQEAKEVLGLLACHSPVILTAESNGAGKSTFARILRHRLTVEAANPEFSDCIYQYMDSVSIAKTPQRRHDRYDPHDSVSYPDLLRFEGVAIFDEVYPDQFPILRTLENPRVLAIVQPVFLRRPSDDPVHQDFLDYLEAEQPPTYWLPHYLYSS